MKLYDEEELKRKNEKDKKLKKYIVIGIFASIIIIALLMGIIFYLIYNPDRITVEVGIVNDKGESRNNKNF